MAMAVLELSAVFDAYERELGEEEAHDVVSMAYIGVGGYFWNDPESSDLSLAELAAFIADGKTYGESRAKL